MSGSRSLPPTPRQARRLAVLGCLSAALLAAGCGTAPEKPRGATGEIAPRSSVIAGPSAFPSGAAVALGPSASAAPPSTRTGTVAKHPAPPVDPSPYFPHTDWWGDESEKGIALDRAAKARRTDKVTKLFADAGVKFPAVEMLYRVFKKEWKLEVWANDEKGTPLKPIATYGICAISGVLGPKHKEGDRQVPEGFYTLNYITTQTAYHLAMYVNYPNPWDKRQSPVSPGSDILVHGSCASIGCVSMGDETIEELYTMASPLYGNHRKIQMHVYPARDMKAVQKDPEFAESVSFWKMIEPTLDKFNEDHLMPAVTFDAGGRYVVDGKTLDLVE